MAHYGYQEQAERQRKTQRNLQLLEQAVAEEPGDLYLQLKLAQTLPRGERRRVVLAGASPLTGFALGSVAALLAAGASERAQWTECGSETLRGRLEPTRMAAPAG